MVGGFFIVKAFIDAARARRFREDRQDDLSPEVQDYLDERAKNQTKPKHEKPLRKFSDFLLRTSESTERYCKSKMASNMRKVDDMPISEEEKDMVREKILNMMNKIEDDQEKRDDELEAHYQRWLAGLDSEIRRENEGR